MAYDISLFKEMEMRKQKEKEDHRKHMLVQTKIKLKKYFSEKKVKKVYLFGSILAENQFNKWSDIDIAVEGMPSFDYFKIFGELEDLLDTENIDLVELEKCRFKDSIEEKGYRIR